MKLQIMLTLVLVTFATSVFASGSPYAVSTPKKWTKYYVDQEIYCAGKGVKNTYADCGFGYFDDYGISINESNQRVLCNKKGFWYCTHIPAYEWTYIENYYGEIVHQSWCSVVSTYKKKNYKHVVKDIGIYPHADSEVESDDN